MCARCARRSTARSDGRRSTPSAAQATGSEMMPRVRIPIKFWVTAAFSVSVACVIAGLSVFVYLRTGADLLKTIDAGLRSRAEVLAATVQHGHPVGPIKPTLIESDEVFAQITNPSGRIIRSSPVLAGHRLVPPAQARSAEGAQLFDPQDQENANRAPL